jgi:hypothetical protein
MHRFAKKSPALKSHSDEKKLGQDSRKNQCREIGLENPSE